MSASSTRFLGLDVGGTNVRTAAWRTAGARPDFIGSAPVPLGYDAFLAFVTERIKDVGRGVEAVGIGLPGRVQEGRPRWVPNLPWLDDTDLAGDLEARLDARVHVANDAQVALLGEARFGAASEARYALLMSVGTGIGGAVLVGRRIVRGAHGVAGAFGWVNFGDAGRAEANRGQLEVLASGTALDRHAVAMSGIATGHDLVDAARAGDARARAAVDTVGTHLGRGLATLVSVFDPELVLVSGGVSEALPAFDAAIAREVERFASPTGRTIPIRAGDLGVRAGAFGAAALAREGEGAFAT